MGEDFFLKTRDSYKRSQQRTIQERLGPKPLLQVPEVQSTSYPCRVLTSELCSRGSRMMLHFGPTGALQLLHLNRVMGCVDSPEAVSDLMAIFQNRPQFGGMLAIEVEDVYEGGLEFKICDADA